eukprot:3265422-Pyramimonas_sp.AAC.1
MTREGGRVGSANNETSNGHGMAKECALIHGPEMRPLMLWRLAINNEVVSMPPAAAAEARGRLLSGR